MGRGRQKAKHTKVARELKYFSPDTNYSALEQELSGHPSQEDLDRWAEYAGPDQDAGSDDVGDRGETRTA